MNIPWTIKNGGIKNCLLRVVMLSWNLITVVTLVNNEQLTTGTYSFKMSYDRFCILCLEHHFQYLRHD